MCVVIPQKGISMSHSQEPVNGTLFGKRVFADEINDIKDELILDYRGGHQIQFRVFLQETEEEKTQTPRRRPYLKEAETDIRQLQAKEHLESPEPGRGK